MIISTWYWQFVKLQSNPADTTYICDISVGASIQTSLIMSINSTITIDGGSRPKNIIILVKFLYGILIRTSNHHVPFVWREDILDFLTQSQLIRGMSPSKQKFKDEFRLTWVKLKTSCLIFDQKIGFWCPWFPWHPKNVCAWEANSGLPVEFHCLAWMEEPIASLIWSWRTGVDAVHSSISNYIRC